MAEIFVQFHFSAPNLLVIIPSHLGYSTDIQSLRHVQRFRPFRHQIPNFYFTRLICFCSLSKFVKYSINFDFAKLNEFFNNVESDVDVFCTFRHISWLALCAVRKNTQGLKTLRTILSYLIMRHSNLLALFISFLLDHLAKVLHKVGSDTDKKKKWTPAFDCDIYLSKNYARINVVQFSVTFDPIETYKDLLEECLLPEISSSACLKAKSALQFLTITP